MQDLFLLDNLLSKDEKKIRDRVQQFITKDALPLIPQAFENAQFPQQLIPKMAELGLLGMTLPKNYGGGEKNYVMYGLACQELEHGDSALRSFVSVQSSLCMFLILNYGTEEQKKNLLVKMAQGKIICCFGLSEPGAGSDPASLKTEAKKVSGGWRINGTKMWITNAPFADIAIIWAKTKTGICAFLVETKNPGFRCEEIKMKLSLRISRTGKIILKDCFVPEENILPGTEKGLGTALHALNQARYGIAWGAIGAAMSCYETSLLYCKERIQFKKNLAKFQLIQKDLVNMLNEIVKAQFLNLQLGRLMDQNQATPVMISLAKMNACREALKIARIGRNLLGAKGITLEYPVMRHMDNLESVFTYEGTDNIHHLIVGKYITGFDAFG